MAAHSPPQSPPLSTAALISPFHRGMQTLNLGHGLVTVEELGFFDRVKRYIDDKVIHQEFLKLLNLYTQEVIDLQTLVEKVFLFLGGSEELFGNFKLLVGWDTHEHGLVPGEEWIVDNVDALDRPKVDLNALRQSGPSYKKLPHSEVELACSGRDALCWSVLNDEWVAHATWVGNQVLMTRCY